MANIFNEIDEDIRKERYQNLWSKYGKFIIGFLMLIVIIFSISQYLQSKNISDNKKILDTYFMAIENIERNQLDLANQKLESVFGEKNKTLIALSGLKLSETYLINDQKEDALFTLENIFNNKTLDTIFRDLALYKYLIIDFENTTIQTIESMIESTSANKRIFYPYLQEIIGIKYLILGSAKKANTIFTELSLDENISFDLKTRLNKLIQIAD
tara:strand:+ start:139 stop:780 length:642 start_codon:yes stop_codon:yes gene_type:complete